MSSSSAAFLGTRARVAFLGSCVEANARGDAREHGVEVLARLRVRGEVAEDHLEQVVLRRRGAGVARSRRGQRAKDKGGVAPSSPSKECWRSTPQQGAGTTRRAEGRRTGRSSTVVSLVAPTRRRVLLWCSSPSAETSAPRFADAHASAPRARATLVPETHVSFPPSFPNSSPDARAAARRAPRRARALARAPEAPRSPHSPSDDTHRASDAAKECRSRHATLEKGKDREEEERAFDKGVVNGGPRRCENEKISFIFLNPKSTGYFRRADVRRRKRFSDTSCAFPFRSLQASLPPSLHKFALIITGGRAACSSQRWAPARPIAGRPASARRGADRGWGAATRAPRFDPARRSSSRARRTRGTPSQTRATSASAATGDPLSWTRGRKRARRRPEARRLRCPGRPPPRSRSSRRQPHSPL